MINRFVNPIAMIPTMIPLIDLGSFTSFYVLCFVYIFQIYIKNYFTKKKKNNFSRILQISLKMSFVYRKGYQINRWLLTDWFLKGFLIHWAKNHSFQFRGFINVLWTILISNFYSMKNIYIVVKPSIDRNPIVVLS